MSDKYMRNTRHATAAHCESSSGAGVVPCRSAPIGR
jgi:hypothetical protein